MKIMGTELRKYKPRFVTYCEEIQPVGSGQIPS